jgi:hypothetical protein
LGGIYLQGLPVSPKQPAGGVLVLIWFDYVIRLLGLPWTHVPALVWPGRIVGATVLCVGCALAIRDLVHGGSSSRLERIGVGLILFALLIAAAAAVSRSAVATDREMPIRYALFAALGQLGIVLASIGTIEKLFSRFVLSSRLAVGSLLLLLVVQQIAVGRAAVAETDKYNDAWRRFEAGVWTPDMTRYVYPDKEQALDKLSILRRAGLQLN